MTSLRVFSRLAALALAFLVVSFESAARVSGRVLLLESPASTPGLRDALRIQLPHGVELDVEPFELGGTAGTRIRRARERLVQRGGRMALWVDEWAQTEAGHEVVVYFVARSGDRALVEIVRVRGNADDELERAIAIKGVVVLEALDESSETMPGGAMLGERSGEHAGPLASRSFEGAVLFQLSALGTVSPAQGMAAFGVGLGLRMDRVRLEGVAIARLATSRSAQSTAGSLRATEIYAGGSLRGGLSLGAFRAGGFFDAGARFMDVEGETSGGVRGSSERSVPALAFGPDLRLELAPWLEARAALGVEVMLLRQRFAVNNDPLLDLGAARGLLDLGLVAALW